MFFIKVISNQILINDIAIYNSYLKCLFKDEYLIDDFTLLDKITSPRFQIQKG
ncbi:hypothetical protein LEP1GSC186_0063 [Leptospira noguchii serovar Autumnalis str. ZUN142]|uniref:Uncharacterized protein n=1 Tax=Leptospira noguchii serovar Autumnalis str. ZUN142 TaxID=1085540 RepID=M6UCH6_9LEPT|nr:hypothetical protein LEP1GSC186_0063 [Leptospira noguchii serovar Autumnalis str. ZUN142]